RWNRERSALRGRSSRVTRRAIGFARQATRRYLRRVRSANVGALHTKLRAEAARMGILDFVRAGVREQMIARPDEFKQLIVYKHPNENIPTFAQLTVDLDECAVFYRSGNPPQIAALPPGRHTLSTQNIPFLNNFVISFTGGNIFQAEVYYVTTRPIFNIPFGGSLGQIFDPASNLSLR